MLRGFPLDLAGRRVRLENLADRPLEVLFDPGGQSLGVRIVFTQANPTLADPLLQLVQFAFIRGILGAGIRTLDLLPTA